MNLVIVGAGASRAVNDLPTAAEALKVWHDIIVSRHQLLALALDCWVGPRWAEENLELAWARIDRAWNERTPGVLSVDMRDLTTPEIDEVWRRADIAQKLEPDEPNYYRTQIPWARAGGYSAERFLSVAAGWELRCLIQKTFSTRATDVAHRAYGTLFAKLKPTAAISFNYDTLLEQCLPSGKWGYHASSEVAVLKPHGSVNWTHRTGPKEDVEFDCELSIDTMGYRGSRLEQNLVVGLRRKIEHTNDEPSNEIRCVLRDVLTRSETAVAEAEKIWIVGYSFPEEDTSFCDVLERATKRRHGTPPLVCVIDKGKPGELLERTQRAFGLATTGSIEHCFHGLMDWCVHGFCGR